MRGHLPYRGDGFSRDFKPRKRFVNLKKSQRLLAKEILGIVAAFALITIMILGVIASSGSIEGTQIMRLILLWMVVLTVIVGIIDLNRFQKGRDVDTSKWDDNEHHESSNDVGE